MEHKRERMPLEQRAKIFIPFEPLSGFNEAIRKKERELEAENPDMNPLGKNQQTGTEQAGQNK